jgi:DNA-binding PadR family transcriptional regulator
MGSDEPVRKISPSQSMKLRPPSYLILGMVRLGAKSGYAIKKATDVSTRAFWPTSLAQVYPELARLERAGLLERRDDPQGGRARSAYEITEEGEAAVLAWLRSSRETPLQFRDEGVLRLFFADALTVDEQLVLVRGLRARAGKAEAQMRSEIVPLAEALERGGTRYPAVVARLGADAYGYADEWLTRLEAQLEAEQASR